MEIHSPSTNILSHFFIHAGTSRMPPRSSCLRVNELICLENESFVEELMNEIYPKKCRSKECKKSRHMRIYSGINSSIFFFSLENR